MKHPSTALLERHAAGDLPHAAWVAIDAHVETCRDCARIVAKAEETEGQRLADTTPLDLSPEVLDRIMASLDNASSPRPLRRRLGDVVLPRAVAEAGIGPRRWLAPGLWTAFVDTHDDDGWRAFLLRTPPGLAVPEHGHEGPELTCVLSGGFRDSGHYTAGDFVQLGEDHQHALRADAEEACVCLIAVQGGLRWRGLARLIRPILGI